jgi:hypothetical protein
MSKTTTNGFKIWEIVISISGVLFLYLGKRLIYYEPLGALLYMVIVLLMVSPFIKFVEQKFNIRLAVVISLALVIILFGIVVVEGSGISIKSIYNRKVKRNLSNDLSDNNRTDNFKFDIKVLEAITDKVNLRTIENASPTIKTPEQRKPNVQATEKGKLNVETSKIDKPKVEASEEVEPEEENETELQEINEPKVEEVYSSGWVAGGSLVSQDGQDGNNKINGGMRSNSSSTTTKDLRFNSTDNSARNSVGACPAINFNNRVCEPTAGAFSLIIDNGFFPVVVGSKGVIQGEDDESSVIQIEITVLDETEEVEGITTRVVEEREFEDGQLVEVSRNFYAQALGGTVCKFGVDVQAFEDGITVSTEGSWRAGENGNEPRIVMPATPEVGMVFSKEVVHGLVEDQAEVVALGEIIEVPAGSFGDTLTIDDCDRFEGRRAGGQKIYVRGIGLAIDDKAELVSF